MDIIKALKRRNFSKLQRAIKGGPGSGNFGHGGRPGQRGGSAPSGGGSSAPAGGGIDAAAEMIDFGDNDVSDDIADYHMDRMSEGALRENFGHIADEQADDEELREVGRDVIMGDERVAEDFFWEMPEHRQLGLIRRNLDEQDVKQLGLD